MSCVPSCSSPVVSLSMISVFKSTTPGTWTDSDRYMFGCFGLLISLSLSLFFLFTMNNPLFFFNCCQLFFHAPSICPLRKNLFAFFGIFFSPVLFLQLRFRLNLNNRVCLNNRVESLPVWKSLSRFSHAPLEPIRQSVVQSAMQHGARNRSSRAIMSAASMLQLTNPRLSLSENLAIL